MLHLNLCMVSYFDVFHQNEVEQSKYNFEIADTEVLFRQFDEAETMNSKLIDESLQIGRASCRERV